MLFRPGSSLKIAICLNSVSAKTCVRDLENTSSSITWGAVKGARPRRIWSRQCNAQIVKDLRQVWSIDQRTGPSDGELGDGAVIDRQICFAIKARGVHNSIWRLRVTVKGQRPMTRRALARTSEDIARHAESNCPIGPQVHYTDRACNFDFGILADAKLALADWKIGDNAIVLITEYRLQEADVQRDAKIENAEAICGNPWARIAKSTGCFTITERIGITRMANSPVQSTCGHRGKIEPYAVKVRGRQPAHHIIAGLARGHDGALGCIDDIGRAPAAQCLNTSQATEFRMMLD